MKGAPDNRRLTIGAYAAATQLTAKALRLYDEQGLLRPTATDPTTGYRYYKMEQVGTGRLIRAYVK
jgi:DNA-binding transcriptional MerR regulator